MLPKETDVLIVGAGPTGLALAILLRQAGVRHVIVDKLAEGQGTSRAAVIHAHTLEMLHELGVADELCRRGLPLTKFTIRDRDRALLKLGFGDLPTSDPYLLMLPQDITERVLAARLAEVGGVLHRGVAATRVTPSDAAVEVALDTGDDEHTITARYVVGADGMRSVVREASGIAFEGSTYGESFVLADVRMHWPLGRDEVSLFFSPAGLVVVAPLPGGAFRIVATLDEAPERPDVADVQALVDARGPAALPGRVTEVIWSSRFRVHHRLAESYRSGRLLLMGDAAHVHSPAGGQGMNTGLVDAIVLGRLLADVVQGRRRDSSLDDYVRLRRPAASKVLALAGRLTGMATVRSARRRRMRNAVLRIANRLPFVRHRIELNLSGLSRRRLAVLPAMGGGEAPPDPQTSGSE
jgi:2-polyprenyl-6-methoxyphenol hydroxylase-like FAD-dependent oxidoreductase